MSAVASEAVQDGVLLIEQVEPHRKHEIARVQA